MTLQFHYKIVARPDGTEVKAPIIPIVLHGKESLGTTGMIDSGADMSAMPKALAEILGLDMSGAQSPAFGIGGKVKAIDTKVAISIEKGHEHYQFFIPMKVILDDYDFPILLGRSGFFDKFIVSFDEKNKRVSLKHID